MSKKQFELYELKAHLGENIGDFDVETIIEDATEVDYSSGNRYWREGIDLNEICQRHDNTDDQEGTMKVYTVAQGWIQYVRVGGIVEERMSDNPASEDFASYEEALEAFNAIDLERDWRTEKMCSGQAWKYSKRDAYKLIETYEIDNDGYSGDVETLRFEKYGEPNDDEE